MKILPLRSAIAALFAIFPAYSQAATNLPPLTLSAELLNVPARPQPIAGADAPDSPALKRNRKLTTLPPPDSGPTPVIIQAQRLQGHKDSEVEAFDDVELRKWGQVMFADHLLYHQPEDEVFAEGHVRIEQKDDVAEGSELRLKFDTKQGYMNAASFELGEQNPVGRGTSDKLWFEGENHYRLEQAEYSTCPTESRDWYLRARELDLDRNIQTGTAHSAQLDFYGVPILYAPWMTFPLDKSRKSGFLAPHFGSTGRSGSEFTLPYYWNIAPNLDATLAPRLMQKRGLQLSGEFRYLMPTFAGEAQADYLPNDQALGIDRYFLMLNHRQALAPGLVGMLNLQKASDNDYFRDLGTQLTATSQIHLPREGILSYTLGRWNLLARMQTFQTLQDVSAPVTPPYHRTPQILLNGGIDGLGADLAVSGEFVNFVHPSLPNGQRSTFYPAVSVPFAESWGFLTPKLGLHLTRYSLDRDTATQPDATRSLPIFSLDGGLHFERETSVFGHAFQQTLEPRLYYLNVPYRDQSQLPVFDSAEADFNYARLFTENRFSGFDRISDANHLTFAVTSRFLESESGRERLRATIGQRYYFSDQQVTLSAPPRSGKTSDFLALLSGNLTSQWSLDSGWQFNPDEGKTEKANISARFSPEAGKTVNLGYRYTRETLRQVDLSTQWPVTRRWQGLGRVNYSMFDSKLVEGLIGMEYDAGCWAFRTVLHSFSTAATQRTNAIFFQLELNGIGHIGTNPLDVLKRNIYGYTKTNESNHDLPQR
ncbi:MAG: LPS-assembly protein LptD [Sulfuricella sp.]|nr:LPS-assembly protein LptD [Sulfuricella sp.]